MKYHTKHSSGLEESIVKFLQTKQKHSRVPYDENWDLCLMQMKCDYAVRTESVYNDGKKIRLCRRIGC